MAIPHFSLKNGSRAKGKSAGAHFSYLVREGRYEKTHHDLEYIRHENYPEWAQKNPIAFWNAADLYERVNGRTYTECEIALPRSLNKSDRVELLKDFLDEVFHTHFPYTAVIHNPIALDGKPNPHAHVMFSERAFDGVERPPETFFSRANKKHPEKGGAAKDRDWSKRTKVAELRQSWQLLTNEALERAGKRERVDLRSLKAQGIDRPPEPKLGQSRTAMYRKGIVTEAAQEVMQIRLIASHQKERAQVRRELGRAKIAQYKEKRKERTVEVSATEVLKMVKKVKRELYEKLDRNEKSQYELGGFKSRGVQEIRFHNTNDSFTLQRRAGLTTRHTQYEHELKDLKKYEKELLLVGDMTLEVREKGNWTEKSAIADPQEFDRSVGRAQEKQREQSMGQERGLSRTLSKEE
ncbi:MobA/MobL family protein [Pleurocapsales cyanobacterium LEGE 10410]|nr:MobA/MobL family protein [Pleurocapsales cyanobacterium LEGE 10410]